MNAALEKTNKEVQGKYLNKCHVQEESDLVISEEGEVLQDRLWVSGRLTLPEYFLKLEM